MIEKGSFGGVFASSPTVAHGKGSKAHGGIHRFIESARGIVRFHYEDAAAWA
jgi:hypothetical protein